VEALNGTLRAAKRQKKVLTVSRNNPDEHTLTLCQVTFNAELLMMPKDKEVQVVLLEE
jgi:hypothetical protein